MPDTKMAMNLREIQCLQKPKQIPHTYYKKHKFQARNNNCIYL